MRYLLSLIVVLLCTVTPAKAQTVGVQNVLGAQLSCDFSNPNCSGFPSTLSFICISTNPACPDNWHPDAVVSARFWGARDADCVTSTDTGATWAVCTTQPFTALTGTNMAGASDGSVIAVGNPAGVCTIRRSTNSGTSWTTTFTDATQCGFGSNAQNVICQPSGGQCDFVTSIGSTGRTYRTTDNGQNWTLTNLGLTTGVAVGSNFVFNGAGGVSGGPSGVGSKSIYATAGVFQYSTDWPASAAPYARSMGFLFGGTPQLIADKLTTSFDRVDVNGVIQNTFTLAGAQAAGNPYLTAFNYGGGFYYMIGQQPTGQGFWLSTDSLVTNALIGSNARTNQRATMRRIGNKVYYSVFGGNFGVIQ